MSFKKIVLANTTIFPSVTTIQKIIKLCFVFKLNGFRMKENNFLRRQACYLL